MTGTRGRRRAVAGAAFGLALAAWPLAGRADVTVERYLKTAGFAGIGAGETTTVEKLSGLRKREAGTMKMTGFLAKMVGDMKTDTITDIARDVEWRIDHGKKTYTESRITPPPEPGKRGEPEGKPEQQEQAERKVRIVRNEVTVKETGERKTISGFDCERHAITWVLETEDLETKARGESTMVTDLWTTPETGETRALQKAEQEFTRAWLKKIGWDLSEAETRKMGVAAVAAFFGGDEESLKKGAKEVAEKMEKVKGYPIATAVVWRSASSGGQPGKGGGIGGGIPEIAKGLGGLMSAFGKKGGGKGGAGSGEAPAGGDRPLFESYAEIRKISTGSLPDTDFQVPAGYTKTE